MAGNRPRNLTFGSVAERYERFRPGYPETLRELVLAGDPSGGGPGGGCRHRQGHPAVRGERPGGHRRRARCADVRGAGQDDGLTPGHRRVQHARGVAAAATGGARLRGGGLALDGPGTRWTRAARLLVPNGVFASFGGPLNLTDEDLRARVEDERAAVIGDEDVPARRTGQTARCAGRATSWRRRRTSRTSRSTTSRPSTGSRRTTWSDSCRRSRRTCCSTSRCGPRCCAGSGHCSRTRWRSGVTSHSTVLAVPTTADPSQMAARGTSQMAASELVSRRRWRRRGGRPVEDGDPMLTEPSQMAVSR